MPNEAIAANVRAVEPDGRLAPSQIEEVRSLIQTELAGTREVDDIVAELLDICHERELGQKLAARFNQKQAEIERLKRELAASRFWIREALLDVGAMKAALASLGHAEILKLAEARPAMVKEQFLRDAAEPGLGIALFDGARQPVSAKDLGCPGRREVCQAICCRFPVALTRREVEDEVASWKWRTPFLLPRAEDGWCIHFDRDARECTIYDRRPFACRCYDCRGDRRVWLDFQAQKVGALVSAQVPAEKDDQPIPTPDVEPPDFSAIPEVPDEEVRYRFDPDDPSASPEEPQGKEATP